MEGLFLPSLSLFSILLSVFGASPVLYFRVLFLSLSSLVSFFICLFTTTCTCRLFFYALEDECNGPVLPDERCRSFSSQSLSLSRAVCGSMLRRNGFSCTIFLALALARALSTLVTLLIILLPHSLPLTLSAVVSRSHLFYGTRERCLSLSLSQRKNVLTQWSFHSLSLPLSLSWHLYFLLCDAQRS